MAPVETAAAGLLAAGLLGLTLHALTRTRARALALAESMTAELRASESSARAVLVAVADGILAVASDGRVRSFSLAAEAVFGRQAAQAVGLPLAALLPDLDLAAGRRETRARHKLRGDLPVEVAVTEMHDGLQRGYVVVVRDISARQRAEREHAAQYAVTRALAESVGPEDALPRVLEALGTALGFDFGAIWLVDRAAGLLRPAADWTALPGACVPLSAETRGLVLPPGRGLPGRVWQAGEPLWIADLGGSAEGYVRRRAGLASGLLNAQGYPIELGRDVLGVLEFFGREATEPGRTQRELLAGVGSQLAQFLERAAADRSRRAADQRARAVVDNMQEGLVVTDAEGRIEEVNQAAERTFGYGSWELLGQSVATLFAQAPPDAPARFESEAWLQAPGTLREWLGRRKGGPTFPASVALVEFRTAEGRRLRAAHVRDLTEERQAERAKKEFVATVSHELRTPLTSIRGALALLSSGVLGELPDEARDVVVIAERNTLRLSTLINDLLDLERLEAGRLELRSETVPLAEVVERAVESVAGLAEAAGVPIEAARRLCRVRGDADRLVQVLVNLLANAIKFSAPGAAVRVEFRPVGAFAEVRVIDRGRGVPPELQPLLFERFQQVEASDAREKGGSGLGLAICRAIVAQHGGQIGLESELGLGSTFWFRVPLAAPQPQAEDGLVRALAGGAGAGPDVLLVEPDPELASVVVRQLLQAGLPARSAADVEAAELARTQQAPAVVVLDPDLPGAGGLCRRLEAGRPAPALVLYTNVDGAAEQRRQLGLSESVPVLTRSRETSGQLAALVSRLHRQAVAWVYEEAS